LEAARSASSSCPCLCPLRGHDHKSDMLIRSQGGDPLAFLRDRRQGDCPPVTSSCYNEE